MWPWVGVGELVPDTCTVPESATCTDAGFDAALRATPSHGLAEQVSTSPLLSIETRVFEATEPVPPEPTVRVTVIEDWACARDQHHETTQRNRRDLRARSLLLCGECSIFFTNIT